MEYSTIHNVSSPHPHSISFIIFGVGLFKSILIIAHHIIITSESCSGGYYLDENDGCKGCGTGTYSPGGTTSSCTACTEGKTSVAGTASQESDCTWGKLNFNSFEFIPFTTILFNLSYILNQAKFN